IGVVCLLIAGGFVGYGGMPPVAAEKDISALWEEIRQSPDPGQALVALGAWDPDAMTALMQYVSQDEAAWQQFLEFEKARPHFWYEFREDGSGRISATPRYPELLEGIVCERCYYKALAEQLPEHPVMEVFYKKLNVRLDAGMPQEVKEAIFCSACLAEVGPSAEKPFPDGNPSSAAAELEPLWWRPTHHSHIGLVERVPFQWEWWFFSETNNTVAGDAGQLYGGSNEPEAGWDAGDTREWQRLTGTSRRGPIRDMSAPRTTIPHRQRGRVRIILRADI
ncbi:hypothetical protein M1N13_04160, partial [Dehalococcoidia bacterium]|nr:hypothetical protein [Dehalococcoidia bacterium]